MNRRAFLATTAAAASAATHESSLCGYRNTLRPNRRSAQVDRAVAFGAAAQVRSIQTRTWNPWSSPRSQLSGLPVFPPSPVPWPWSALLLGSAGPKARCISRLGAMVLFSDIPNNRIMRLVEDDNHLSVFRQPSMNSNGNTIDREGRLITCEHSGRRVTRTEFDGSITIIADSYNGKKLNSPNDVVVASDGSIWFTDPAYGIGGYYEGIKAAPEQEKHNVYRVDPKSGNIKVVVDDFVEPNGITFSPDEKKLYIIDTGFTDGRKQSVAYPCVRRGCREWQSVERQGLRGNAEAEHHRWHAR